MKDSEQHKKKMHIAFERKLPRPRGVEQIESVYTFCVIILFMGLQDKNIYCEINHHGSPNEAESRSKAAAVKPGGKKIG